MITKEEIDKLVQTYETKEFFYDDPVGIPNRFSDKKDKEIAGFIASLVAYGRREVFLKKLAILFEIAQNEPLNFILNFEPEVLGDFNYRFGKPDDFAQIFNIMRDLYEKEGGLEELFKYGYENQINDNMFIPVTDYFYSKARDNSAQGFRFMLPDARKGSAMKRMCMYLRWMVRKGPVDFGLWDFMPASDLYIPLDTHVARISREMGLLTRNANDFKSVIELTENLKKFDANDPAKYDFALFGYGVNNKG
ncbi:MAG: TIGR02757 family protein [Candidatus Melainabacteria bacterium 35_41]|nr:MAG: TIGR02757 family protein [Candidatus Melainabacteria bacterium 35_41]